MEKKREPGLIERFEAKIYYALDGCWYWIGETLKIGYGRSYYGNNQGFDYAHRMSYKIFKGEIPDNMLVCHSCDNPLCVNPSHLFLGSHKDNTHDMIRKGRGSKPPTSKVKVDLSGRVFGKLTVLKRSDQRQMWDCRCECGVEKPVNYSKLVDGETRSCGCNRIAYMLESRTLKSTNDL